MKYIVAFSILIVGLLLVLCIKYKVKVKLKTFFKRGFKPKRGQFGLYVYDGKQAGIVRFSGLITGIYLRSGIS